MCYYFLSISVYLGTIKLHENTNPVKIVDHSVNGREFQMSFYPILQAPPEEIGRLSEFYLLWNSLREDKKIPFRDQFNFESLQGWHSSIRLVDLGAEVLSPKRNLILGENYKQYWGTETMYSQIIESDDVSAGCKQKYQECLSCFLNYNYGVSIGVAPNESGSGQQIIWIDLPLSDGNDHITHLITALIPR